MTKLQKGFTLIELLVVIAIIGILAGILFVAINPAEQTAKAKDSNIKSSLAGVPTAAALANAESFKDVCTTGTDQGDAVDKLIASAQGNDGTTTCNAATTGDSFTISSTLNNSSKLFCVDQNGATEVDSVATAGVSCK